MNHLEPLSWDASPKSAPFVAQDLRAHTGDAMPASEDAVREGLDHARSVSATRAMIRLILAFRRSVDRSAAPAGLAAIARVTLELARIEFAQLERAPWCGARFRADCSQCISGLEGLVATLSGDRPLPAFELAHAMDTLIALLVQADGARRSTGHIAS